MSSKFCRKVGLLCGLIAVLTLYDRAASQPSKPPLPKPHRHIGVDKSASGEGISEFSMIETVPEAGMRKENLVRNRSWEYGAFTVSGTRLFVAEWRTGKVFEIRGLPLEWRPFSDLIWADNQTLMFDRWSQPHYGVHYSVNVRGRRLVAAVPFPDNFYSERGRPRRKNN
jgi:hypothetical protein